MISLSAEALSVLTSSFRYYCAVESWLGGTLLAASVPVVNGGEESDRSLRVPERVSFTVPRVADGVDWSPVEGSALASDGQRLHVKLGVGLSQGQVEWFTRGRFLIQDSEVNGDQVDVVAVGMLALIDEARLISPYQPSGTLVSTLRGLLEPALTVLVDAGLTDRSVPSAINYDEDRLGAVLELLDAWPAAGYIDPEGFLQAVPATQSTAPVIQLTDGVGGTVIRASGGSKRDGAQNVIVARGTASDGSAVQGVSYLTYGPKSYSGNFNPLPVPYFFSSPLLTTIGQCTAAANTIRDRKIRENAREYRVQMVPHPALQFGDVIGLTSASLGLAAVPCSIESLSLPYTVAGGSMPAMTLTARVIS
jgi:hypothetical protein